MEEKGENSAVFYEGEIEQNENECALANFLRRSGEKFIFPRQVDKAEVDLTDAEFRLPVPPFTGGTEKSAKRPGIWMWPFHLQCQVNEVFVCIVFSWILFSFVLLTLLLE